MANATVVNEKVDAVQSAVNRASAELRDLASKVTAPGASEAELQAIADRLSGLADGLNAVVTEVDSDGSSPA